MPIPTNLQKPQARARRQGGYSNKQFGCCPRRTDAIARPRRCEAAPRRRRRTAKHVRTTHNTREHGPLQLRVRSRHHRRPPERGVRSPPCKHRSPTERYMRSPLSELINDAATGSSGAQLRRHPAGGARGRAPGRVRAIAREISRLEAERAAASARTPRAHRRRRHHRHSPIVRHAGIQGRFDVK